MENLPWHPALVHLPLGLALAAPVVALIVLFSTRAASNPRMPRVLLIVLQVMILAGGYFAMQTGEDDEEIVEAKVAHEHIEEHEEAAELFTISAGVVLAVCLIALALPKGRPAWWGGVAALIGTIAVAILGARAGHLGGLLVYQHGAATPHVEAVPAPVEVDKPVDDEKR